MTDGPSQTVRSVRDGVSPPASGDPPGDWPHPLRVLSLDHPATQMGIRLALAPAAVCEAADDRGSAIRAAKAGQPHVAIVGAGACPDWSGLVCAIGRVAPRCAVLVLGEDAGSDGLLEAIRCGAMGYLPGPVAADRLRPSVEALARGEAALPRALVGDVLIELRALMSAREMLTGREAQVLGLLRHGHSTAGIAERLQIAPVTVRRHVSELMRKFGVADRAELIESSSWPARL